MKTLKELLVHGLEELYRGETQLIKILPALRNSATERDLKSIFEDHIKIKEDQRNNLDSIYQRLGVTSGKGYSPVIDMMITEIHEILREKAPDRIQDIRLIDAATKITQYQIAGYTCCVRYAKELDHIETARKLQRMLDEEYAMNTLLEHVAEDRLMDQLA